MKKAALLVLLAFVSTLAAAPALAQNPQNLPPETPASLFGEVVDVRVINLEVVVTEKGERVTGLQPEDFILMVDGEEVPLEYFTEVHGGTAVQRGDELEVGTLPALAPGEPVGTSYLVFIDEYFTVPPRRNRILKRVIDQLPVMTPEDRMAVVAFNGKKLDMLSTWSQSLPELEKVLQEALDRPAYGLQRITERRTFNGNQALIEERRARLAVSGDSTFFQTRLDIDEELEAEILSRQVEKVVLAATSALRGFANPPGRKVMLLLSGGWPYDIVQWVVGDLRQSVFDSSIADGEALYEPLVDTANRLSYTLYPVELRQEDDPSADAELQTLVEADFGRDVFFDRQQNERVALDVLAKDTGGRALYGAAGLSVLERAAADTRSYYWIGFTPAWKGDDSSHTVRVLARRDGMKARSRRSFSDLSRQTEVSMMVESSLLFGDSPSSVPIAAQFGESKKSGRGKVEIPLTVAVPLAELTFLPGQGRWVAEAELRVAVQDDQGNLSEIPIIPLQIAREAAPGQDEWGKYETMLRMRKRKHDVVVSVYDVASGKILATRLEVDPEPPKPGHN